VLGLDVTGPLVGGAVAEEVLAALVELADGVMVSVGAPESEPPHPAASTAVAAARAVAAAFGLIFISPPRVNTPPYDDGRYVSEAIGRG
jgi:hypothetical protein